MYMVRKQAMCGDCRRAACGRRPRLQAAKRRLLQQEGRQRSHALARARSRAARVPESSQARPCPAPPAGRVDGHGVQSTIRGAAGPGAALTIRKSTAKFLSVLPAMVAADPLCGLEGRGGRRREGSLAAKSEEV